MMVTTVTVYPVGPRIQSQTSVTQLEGIGPSQMRCRRRKEEEKDRREGERYLYLVTGDFPKRTTTHVRLCVHFAAPRNFPVITVSADQLHYGDNTFSAKASQIRRQGGATAVDCQHDLTRPGPQISAKLNSYV